VSRLVAESIALAVIGGSGFYDMPGLANVQEIELDTPFGAPSSPIRTGSLDGVNVAFLARHGGGHTISPSELPQRANFWALKSLGVERVLAVSAVGSLRQDFSPGDIVVPDQLVDRTLGNRPPTFFGDGLVAHVSMAEPFCPALRASTVAAGSRGDSTLHDGGSYVVIEGPAFGTRAESRLYRSWSIDVVGMTALPEARLAREAELCYSVLAAVTDYDSWHESEEDVQASAIFETLRKNVEASLSAVRALAENLPPRTACGCATTLDAAIATDLAAVPDSTLERLGPIIKRRVAAVGAP
jgi:5'-methylthioadenosine phosphorylase